VEPDDARVHDRRQRLVGAARRAPPLPESDADLRAGARARDRHTGHIRRRTARLTTARSRAATRRAASASRPSWSSRSRQRGPRPRTLRRRHGAPVWSAPERSRSPSSSVSRASISAPTFRVTSLRARSWARASAARPAASTWHAAARRDDRVALEVRAPSTPAPRAPGARLPLSGTRTEKRLNVRPPCGTFPSPDGCSPTPWPLPRAP
jgi:hypothetical protein